MSTTTRQAAIAGVVAVACLSGALYTAAELGAARADCAAAAGLLAEVRQFGEELDAVRRQGGADAPDPGDLMQRIHRATRDSGIAADRVVQITPRRPRTVDRTVLIEHAVRVNLRRVTLRQLVMFVHGVAGKDRHVRARSLRLTAPADDHGSEWDAEVEFVQFTHDTRPHSRPGDH